jgi:formate dehydrogenase subunit delta
MDVQHLVKMANQIEQFFRADPDPDNAVAGIESHLRRNWDPRMRTAIIQYCKQGGEGLGELAKRAVLRLPPPPSQEAARP